MAGYRLKLDIQLFQTRNIQYPTTTGNIDPANEKSSIRPEPRILGWNRISEPDLVLSGLSGVSLRNQYPVQSK